MARRLAVIGVVTVVIVASLAWYVTGFLMSSPAAVAIPVQAGATPTAQMTLQTVASLGNGYSEPSYGSPTSSRIASGKWRHSDAIFTLPAHALVHVTIYQFDSATGLRNPFLARPEGVVGDVMQLDGKTVDVIDPTLTSHTFVVPALHLVVPLPGVADNAKNTCS